MKVTYLSFVGVVEVPEGADAEKIMRQVEEYLQWHESRSESGPETPPELPETDKIMLAVTVDDLEITAYRLKNHPEWVLLYVQPVYACWLEIALTPWPLRVLEPVAMGATGSQKYTALPQFLVGYQDKDVEWKVSITVGDKTYSFEGTLQGPEYLKGLVSTLQAMNHRHMGKQATITCELSSGLIIYHGAETWDWCNPCEH